MTCEIIFFGQLVPQTQRVRSGMDRGWLSNDPQLWPGLMPHRCSGVLPLVCWPAIQLVFVHLERDIRSLAWYFLALDYMTVILALYI